MRFVRVIRVAVCPVCPLCVPAPPGVFLPCVSRLPPVSFYRYRVTAEGKTATIRTHTHCGTHRVMAAPVEKKVTFSASPPPLPQWEMEASTPSVRVTEKNLDDLSPFVPTDLGHFVWMKVRSTWKGVVCEATIYEYSEGFERRSDEANGRKLSPISAVRLIQEVDGFENDALRHLSLKATHTALSGVSKPSAVAISAGAAASAAAIAGVPPTPIPVPAHIFNDQSLLQRLEDHIESAAFNAALERFAAEHAHKFKPLGPNEEHPLHYQELYRLFEQVLETALGPSCARLRMASDCL